ncbi:hypothetical protein, partial [Dickeya dadantii]|uniref:hypothetical protein n=1 Tax=Dickeya dadantii TaxID=204038 RepID=UPI001F394A98
LRHSPSLFGPPATRLLAPSLGLALRASVNAVQKRSRRFCPARHGLSRHPCRSPGEVARLSTVFDAGKILPPVTKGFVHILFFVFGLASLFLLYLPLLAPYRM